MLKSVAGGAPRPVSPPQPVSAPASEQAPLAVIASLSDIAELAGKRRDIAFRIQLEKYVSLVKLEPGRIDINLADGAPKTLAGDLSKRLQEWTGQRWMVSVSAQKLTQTLEEAATERRDGLMSDAKADPDVAAILARFPGSRIIDVKIKGEPALSETAAEDAVIIENAAPDDETDDN